LPETIGNLSELRELYIKSNELDKFPSSIKNLDNLRILHLWGNRFENLPPEIGELKGLKELYLQDNRLRDLPEEITKLKLSYIDIQDNKLCSLKGKVHTWLKNYDDEYKKIQRCQDEVRFQ
ncbi:MAG: leucine-rich repeat domain-containing protein, partial [Chitinivibrionales bacterium]